MKPKCFVSQSFVEAGARGIGVLIRHQPARSLSTRVRDLERLQVCKQCAGKVEETQSE